MTEMLWSMEQLKELLLASCDTMPHVRAALGFAEKHHKGQYRRSIRSTDPVPYLYHPLVIACQAVSLGLLEDDILCACLLHDVCEDCGVDPSELPCSVRAQEAVRCLSKSPDFDHSAEMTKAYFDRISHDRIAVLVKLMDRIQNISGMLYAFSDLRIVSYLEETKTYLFPLLSQAEKSYPELRAPLFQIRYQLQSLTESIEDRMQM